MNHQHNSCRLWARPFLLLCLVGAVWGGSSSSDGYTAYNDVTPIPGNGRSDMSATLFEGALFSSGKARIYLVGGCIQDQQCPPNQFCSCPGITADCAYYEPETDTWGTCAPAPRDRYRHAAAKLNNKLYLFGGRTVSDGLITEVDEFDPVSDTWSGSPWSWAGASSDLAAFTDGSEAYLVGGYDGGYTALATLSKYNPSSQSLTTLASMPGGGRGDIAAVSAAGQASHLVIGGFGSGSFCDPLKRVEEFNIETQSWSTASELLLGRADMAVGTISNHVFAIAGETTEASCSSSSSVSIPVNDVERLTAQGWLVEDGIPSDRFRFVGAAFGRTIYLFGGQGTLNTDTSPPTHHVLSTTTRYVPTTIHEEDLSDEELAGIVIAGIVAAGVAVAGVCGYLSYRKYKQYKSLASEAAAAEATESIERPPEFKSAGGAGLKPDAAEPEAISVQMDPAASEQI